MSKLSEQVRTWAELADAGNPIEIDAGGLRAIALALESREAKAATSSGDELPTNWQPSFVAPDIVRGCGQMVTWTYLAQRCALLHHVTMRGSRDLSSTEDIEALTDFYVEAGPEFCMAMLDRANTFYEVPF